MYNDDDRKWLYEQMQRNGVDTGNYDEFTNSLNNKEDRDWYYQKSIDLGLDVGSADDFAGMMVSSGAAGPHPGENGGGALADLRNNVGSLLTTGKVTPAPSKGDIHPLPLPEGGASEGQISGDDSVTLPNGERYSREVWDRFNSPDNKAGSFKDLSQFAAEEDSMRRAEADRRRKEEEGRNFLYSRYGMSGIPVRSYFSPVGVNLDKDAGWRDKSVKLSGRDARAGDVADDLYEEGKSYFDTVRGGAATGKETVGAHLLRRAEDWGMKDAGGDDWESAELRRAVVDKALRRLLSERARELARRVMEGVSSGSGDMNEALRDAWYRRDIQDGMRDVDAYSGISYAAFLDLYMKPALKAEGERTGKDVSVAVNGLFRQEGLAEERMAISDEIKAAEDESKRLDEELKRRGKELDDANDFNIPTYAGQQIDRYSLIRMKDEEFQSLLAAKAQVDERIRLLTAKRDDKGFWGGVKDAVSDPNTWLLGLPELANAMAVSRVKDKMESGEELSAAERSLLENTYANNEAQEYYNDKLNKTYGWGKMFGYMVPFVGEFAVTGGGYGMINAGTRLGARAAAKVTGEGLMKETSRWMLRNLGIVADDVTGAVLMANTTGAGKTAADIIGRHTGTLTKDDQGRYKFTDGKSWGRSIYEGEVANTLEYYTEKLGAHTEGVLGAAGKAVKGAVKGATGKAGVWLTKGAEKIGLGRLSRAVSQVNGSDFMKQTKGFLSKSGGVQDYPSEVLEEEANIMLNSLLVGDNQFSDLWDGKTQGDIWGGMLYSIALMRTPGLVGGSYQTAQYYRYRHKAEIADAVAAYRLSPDRWKPWKERIDGTSNDEIGSLADEVLHDSSLAAQEKKAVFGYINHVVRMRGYNMGTLKAAQAAAEENALTNEDGERGAGAEASSAYHEGYNAHDVQEMQDIPQRYAEARSRIADLVSDDMLRRITEDPEGVLAEVRRMSEDPNEQYMGTAWDDAEIAVLSEYVEAKTAYDGMVAAIEDDADIVATGEREQHRLMLHADGSIHSATLKEKDENGNDKQVYIVDGNVVMTADGSAVDSQSSDKIVVIYDPSTGRRKTIDPSSGN